MAPDMAGNELFIQLEDIFGGLQNVNRNVPSILPLIEDNRRMGNIIYPYSSNTNSRNDPPNSGTWSTSTPTFFN